MRISDTERCGGSRKFQVANVFTAKIESGAV
jgi:hypothetical protein